jgi:hypothetical protein
MIARDGLRRSWRAEAQITSKILDENNRSHLSLPLLQQRRIAESTQCCCGSVLRSHSLANESLYKEFEMPLQLIARIAV